MTRYMTRKVLWGAFGTLVLVLIGFGIWGCSEEDNYYRTVTNPCCADGCTDESHSDPCHPDCWTGNNYTICFNGTTIKIPKTEWDWYKARGATKGKCPKGDDDDDDDDQVLVCHFGQNVWIPAHLLQQHLAHGDTRGKCPHGDDDDDDDGKVCICHFPPGNPENHHTICIGAPAVPAHLSNHPGDHVGACEDGS